MNARGARTQRRAAERTERGTKRLEVPDHIRAMAKLSSQPARPRCPIDPDCPRDHLRRKGRMPC